MKTILLLAFYSATMLSATTFKIEARIVTLAVNSVPSRGPTNFVSELEIKSNEVATVKFFYAIPNESSGQLTIVKNGIEFYQPQSQNSVVVAGPATIKLQGTGSQPGLCTIEITPESFPPDKSVIVPAGTSASIALEKSSDLIHWESVSPGSYTNREQNLFFRIKAERIP